MLKNAPTTRSVASFPLWLCRVCRTERCASRVLISASPVSIRVMARERQVAFAAGLPHSAMRASKLPLSVWAQAFHLCVLSSNADAMDIRDALLPVTQRTACSLAKRIHEAWSIEGDVLGKISGEVNDD